MESLNYINTVWAPMSEIFGRRPIILASYLPFAVFTIGSALAKNVPTLLISRFLSGKEYYLDTPPARKKITNLLIVLRNCSNVWECSSDKFRRSHL